MAEKDSKLTDVNLDKAGGTRSIIGLTAIGVTSVAVVVGAIMYASSSYFGRSTAEQAQVNLGRAEQRVERMGAAPGSAVSPIYEEEYRTRYRIQLDNIRRDPYGVGIPETLGLREDGRPLTPEELMTMLRSLYEEGGLDFLKASERTGIQRVGSGDIRLAENGALIDENGQPILFDGVPVAAQENRRIVSADPTRTAMLLGQREVYLGENGQLVFEDSRIAEHRGIYTSHDYRIIGINGRFLDGSQMQQVGSCDIYQVPSSNQLASHDGRGFLLNGRDVFVDRTEQVLVRRDRSPARYRDERIFMGADGVFYTEIIAANRRIQEGGVLITRGGVTIGSDCMLTSSIGGISRVGSSDIFADDTGMLFTEGRSKILFNGQHVRVAADRSLRTASGNVQDRNGAELVLSSEGRIVYLNGRQTEFLSTLVAESGRLFNSSGRVIGPEQGDRLGSSDIIVLEDGTLTDLDGRAVFSTIPSRSLVYLDENRYLRRAATGSIATTRIGERIRIDDQGRLRTGSWGDLRAPTAAIVDNEGVAYGSDGKKISTETGVVLIGNDGEVVEHGRGRSATRVQVMPNLQLYTIQETRGVTDVVYIEENDSRIAFRPDGQLINTTSGEIINYRSFGWEGKDPFSLRGTSTQIGGHGSQFNLTEDGVLLGSDGSPLLGHQRQQLFVRRDLSIVYADGAPHRVNNRNVKMDLSRGVVLDNGNQPEGFSFITTSSGRYIDTRGRALSVESTERITGSDIYTARDGFLLDNAGRILMGPHDGFLAYGAENRLLEHRLDGPPRSLNNRRGRSLSLSMTGEIISQGSVEKPGDALLTFDGVAYTSKATRPHDSGLLNSLQATEVFLNEDRMVTNSSGQPVYDHGSHDIFFIDSDRALKGGREDHLTLHRNRIYVAGAGLLVDAGDTPITSSSGERYYLTVNGIQTESGEPVGVSTARPFGSRGEVLDEAEIAARRGLTALGDGIYVDADGNIVDAFGNPILDVDGRQMTAAEARGLRSIGDGRYVDEHGNIVDADGNPILGADGSPLRVTEDGLIPLGDGLFMDADGNIVDADGNPILGADGRPMTMADYQAARDAGLTPLGDGIFMDADGNLVDADGNPILGADGRPMTLDELQAARAAGLTPMGGGLFRDADGNIVDEHGNIISADDLALAEARGWTALGDGIFMDEHGNLVDADGNPILGADGRPMTLEEFQAARAAGITPLGGGLFMDADGNIVDADGNPVLGADGKPMTLADLDAARAAGLTPLGGGLFRDADGNIVSADDLALAEARGWTALGDGIFMDADGNLVDADGNPILGADGRPMTLDELQAARAAGRTPLGDGRFMDADGNIVDADGNIIRYADGSIPAGDSVASGSGLRALTGPDGRPLYGPDGRPLFVDEDGNIVDEFGNVIRVDGERLRLGPDGNVITESGRTLDGVMLDMGGSRVDGLDGGRTYGRGRSGFLVDSAGRPVRINGQAISVGRDGTILGSGGRPMLSDSGQRIQLTPDGRIVDEDGRSIQAADDSLIRDLAKGGIRAVDPRSLGLRRPISPQERAAQSLSEMRNSVPLFGYGESAEDMANDLINDLRSNLDGIYSDLEQAYLEGVSPDSMGGPPEPPEQEDSNGGQDVADGNGRPDSGSGSGGKLLISAADMLMCINSFEINSDFPVAISCEVVSGERGIRGSTMFGQFARVEDFLVLEFDRMRLPSGEMIQGIEAIAMDGNARNRPAFQSSVNRHFLYRYGSFTAATILAGLGEAAQLARGQDVVIDGDGNAIQKQAPLSPSEMAMIVVGEVGKGLSEHFMENMNRAPTVVLNEREPIGLYFVNDVRLPE